MRYLLLCLTLFFCTCVRAQEKLNYQQPPDEILELVDVPLAPQVLMDHEREYMLLRPLQIDR